MIGGSLSFIVHSLIKGYWGLWVRAWGGGGVRELNFDLKGLPIVSIRGSFLAIPYIKDWGLGFGV